jgi:hypothetical protein
MFVGSRCDHHRGSVQDTERGDQRDTILTFKDSVSLLIAVGRFSSLPEEEEQYSPERGARMMRIRGVWRGSGLTLLGGFTLGVLGLVLVSLAMSGCSSGSGGDSAASGGSAAGTLGLLSVEASGTAGIAPGLAMCGDEQEETLWAGEHIDVGTVEVANDTDYLYVKFEIDGDWGMEKGWVHVGADETDYPGYGEGNDNYKLGRFDYYIPPQDGTVYEEYTVEIEFADLGLDHGDCEITFTVFACAKVKLLDDDGHAIETRMAWGGTDKNLTASASWMYYIEYELQCCGWYGNDSDFRSQSQGGWGTVCHGWNPGCYRDMWFDTAFPAGVTIGYDLCDLITDGHTLTFTSSEAVEEYLPSGGKPGPLEGTETDPTERRGGVLASQTLALALTLGFDETDEDFGASEELLADQVICNTGTAFDTWTVGALFEEANWLLAGCDSDYEPGEIAEALEIVNENYSDGDADMGYICAD